MASQLSGGGEGEEGVRATPRKLTTFNNAFNYLKEVEEMFQDQKQKYYMFLEVLKDFYTRRTDKAVVVAMVKELFQGHNNLILGFNTFLPKEYEITIEEDEAPENQKNGIEEAINFVNKIKIRFQNDKHVYKSFLDILKMYRAGQKDITVVYKEFVALFDGHQDLLEDVISFLPDTSVAALTNHAS